MTAAVATLPPAIFSPDRRYRYMLIRHVGDGDRVCLFCMLNPSTADEEVNDPTITRDIGFARAWECGWLIVVNLFAYRATNPADMKSPTVEPVGFLNDHHILQAAALADLRVCAWGSHGSYGGRSKHVKKMLLGQGYTLHHLGLTKGGEPKHPLYLPARQELTEWAG